MMLFVGVLMLIEVMVAAFVSWIVVIFVIIVMVVLVKMVGDGGFHCCCCCCYLRSLSIFLCHMDCC